MKLPRFLIALSVLLSVAAPLTAEPTDKHHLLSVDPGAIDFDYAESVTPPHKSTDTGKFPGVRVSYRQTFSNGWGIAGNLDVLTGKTTYDGSTQSGDPISFQSSPNRVVNFEVLGTRAVTSG